MRRLADRLGITVAEAAWPDLVAAAGFSAMKRQADHRVPDRLGVLKDPASFFRRGVSGEGRATLSDADYDRYLHRVSAFAPADVVAWLHHDH
jgi:hypothetical protein